MPHRAGNVDQEHQVGWWPLGGLQVHRSWWVNYRQVRSARKSGRSIELLMENKLTVPVSLANRNTVIKVLEGKVDGI